MIEMKTSSFAEKPLSTDSKIVTGKVMPIALASVFFNESGVANRNATFSTSAAIAEIYIERTIAFGALTRAPLVSSLT